MSLFQGLLNNLKEVSADDLTKEFGRYLIEGEEIVSGFKLVRDILIFTNFRIIDFDKQGASGKKMSVKSVYIESICEVSCETAGFGFDDSEIEIHYIKSPYRRAHDIQLASRKYEFPKKFDVSTLYRTIETIAQQNVTRLNAN